MQADEKIGTGGWDDKYIYTRWLVCDRRSSMGKKVRKRIKRVFDIHISIEILGCGVVQCSTNAI
jgi:hypothetical protein